MNAATARATQRELDAALQPLPLTPLPDVFEWFGEPGRELYAAAREQENTLIRQHAKQSARRFTGELQTGFGGL